MQEIKEEFKMGRQINLNQFIEENHGESCLEKVTAFSSFLELAQEGVVILNQKEPKIRWVHCEIQASRGASFY
jgi:chromatin segregation and condensation protein Rec8/ScpA/Scc1 (kleisin family)